MHKSSLDLYSRASVIPGRSMTRSKAPGRLFAVTDGPLYASSARGATLVDAEGRSYVDMICGLGAISLGYRPLLVEHAGVFSLPHRLEVEAAEAVLEHVTPWAKSVRFMKTGSEATHAAYRIAKGATGRKHVFFGDWAYHGWHEWSQGNSDVARTIFHNEDLNTCHEAYYPAAVFIEPHRWEPVDIEWLKKVREFCTRSGALLIFDEMIYGGRWALGGATEYFGIIPDLACYGKAFGNGQAVAFVVGNDALLEHGEIVSGTYSGDITGLAAVLDVLDVYRREPVIEALWERGRG
jgi:glutamate-1-semialdehyde 2,1-aminomutase